MKVSQAQREQAKTESDSAFELLRADMERYNAEQSKEMVKFMVAMAATTIGILGGIIVLAQFFFISRKRIHQPPTNDGDVSQPLFSRFAIHFVIPSHRYFDSVCKSPSQEPSNASNAVTAAIRYIPAILPQIAASTLLLS